MPHNDRHFQFFVSNPELLKTYKKEVLYYSEHMKERLTESLKINMDV